ncbi:hypothetical protein ACFUEN_28785 [Streptomyces griseorubiginosus]|uniref:hypothetical protein n=1 Tax=Streptomyces griseorubiginosus TaxID=67304 RepID=UPI003628F818
MAPKLSQLQDFFAAPTLNTALWNASSASPNVVLDTTLDRVAVSCTTNYYVLASQSWDATTATGAEPNGVYARVVPVPVGGGTTETFFELVLDANNKASLFYSGGAFAARVTNAGVNTSVTIAASAAAYDAYSFAWWRITESAGSFIFSTSPDGQTWTTRATIAHSWSAIAVKFQFVTGFYGSETAGQFAYIDHVNTTTSARDQPNLNFPLIEDGWAPFWNANGGSFPLDRYVDVSDRTRGGVQFGRGRQYETDQVRSGEAQLVLANPDALLDPVNASGPWYGYIFPYQPYRRRAQWPPTRNLLDQVMATGGDLGGFALGTISVSATDIFSSTDSSNGSFVSSATAWQGSTVMQFAVPSGTAAATRICHTPRFSVVPGRTYTVSLRVRDVTAATSLSVQAFAGWYTAGGGGAPTSFTYGSSSSLTGSTTAGWTTITVTATAPANAAGIDVGVAVAATAAATCNVQVDGWQLERGSTATTFQVPGIWFPVYAGFMERWPSKWDMDGTYGLVSPNAVDAFSLLSQQTLSDPLTQEIDANSPRFLYKLDDPAGSTSTADFTGNNPAAQIGISKYGAGSLVFGTEITATDATGTYTGSTGTVATFNNANPGQSVTAAATFLKLGSAGILGPATNPWTRMIAFKYTGPTPTGAATIWSCFDSQRANGNPSGSNLLLAINSSGTLQWSSQGPTGVGGARLSSVNVLDGDWHLAIFGMDPANSAGFISVDGNTTFYAPNPASAPSGLISDNIGAYVDPTVGNGTTQTYKGDVSFAAEFASYLGTTAIANLYSAWKSSCAGESTNARYARILRYAGYTGPTSIQTGLTTSMGPANLDGTDAVSALEAVVATEGGAHYVSRAGDITFKSRSNRYNALTPVYVFGERADLGEWPYEDCETDYDSTHLSNQVTVTQEASGQNFYAQDATSATNYFPRTLTRTVNSSSAGECQDAANYLLSRYRQPATRVSTLKLHPSANPALWPVCLGLELGTRVRVMRRPPGVPATTVECFVENIEWDWGADGDVFQTLQCSPADLTPYGLFAAWHTTLASSIGSGVTSITVNASQDNTNRLAAQLAAGQQIVLGQNTANQETVTVSVVGATSPGWTTATITLTAATTKAHTSGDTVCEPLPAGVTDPTTWDSSRFDSTAFAY